MGTENYREYFSRNQGLFRPEEQERLRKATVLIIGLGGVGGTVATLLARSGVSRFILVEFDRFEPTNMNRQVFCFTDTLGTNKAEAAGAYIRKINPGAEVEIHPRLLSREEVLELAKRADLVFPAADDFAFSLLCFRGVQEMGKTSLLVVPAGFWACVSIIRPDGPSAESIHGVPRGLDYEGLKRIFTEKRYKLATYYNYVIQGRWSRDYYRDYIDEGRPLAQVAPVVWLASSLGAWEVLKFLTGKEKAVTAPRYYWVSRKGVSVQRLYGFNLNSFFILQRKLFWRLFQGPLGGMIEPLEMWWWNRIKGKR
ncbi:MAG: ThiF family adenylyltransferase [bacterium]|nr:ThiF family adenylyltransferase [bacterium]